MVTNQSDQYSFDTHQEEASMSQPPALTAEEQHVNDAWNADF